MEKANNSIATRMQVSLLNNRNPQNTIFSTRHNSMTELCRALLKYVTERKIG